MHTSPYYITPSPPAAPDAPNPIRHTHTLIEWLMASCWTRSWAFLSTMTNPDPSYPNPVTVHKGLVKRGGDGSAVPALIAIAISVGVVAMVVTIICCAKRSHAKAFAEQRQRGRVDGHERRRPRAQRHQNWYGGGRSQGGYPAEEDYEMGPPVYTSNKPPSYRTQRSERSFGAPSELSSRYAILSHTWGDDELLFEDIPDLASASSKYGYTKVYHACQQAARDGLPYLWADTCCIDKRSSAELQENINSMFRWYALAKVCYVHLSDVHAGPNWNAQFRSSRWFTRCWTLQELIAPCDVQFYDADWQLLGQLRDLVHEVQSITSIDARLLQHRREPYTYSIAQRMSWAADRSASRIEDVAYSLLGIFDVNMSMLYGEGTKAFTRLQQEIIKVSTDHSIFAWEPEENIAVQGPRGVLASSPADFKHCGRIGRLSGLLPGSFQVINRGLEIPLPISDVQDTETGHVVLALLDCHRSASDRRPYFALQLRPLPKLLNPRNARPGLDQGLSSEHATASFLVVRLLHLTEEEFRQYISSFKAERISLFSGEDFRTGLFTPGQLWMTPAAKLKQGTPAQFVKWHTAAQTPGYDPSHPANRSRNTGLYFGRTAC